MTTKLIPYLNFDGQTTEAMKLYQSILGGKLSLQTFAEAFPDTSPDLKDRIMHAHLETDELSIMASDTHPKHSPPLVSGNNVNLSIVGSDENRLTEYFNKLAENGKVQMPLEKQFWGDVFGALEDRFGIHWMVNISSAE
jgi:PhnB protein